MTVMIFGDVSAFDGIVETLRHLETEINAGADG